MTHDITPYGSAYELSRSARRTVRAISRHQATAQVRIAAADAATDVAIAKVEDFTMATGTGMTAVTRIARGQRELEQQEPGSAGRLAFLADDHLLGIGELLADYRHELRRR